MCVQHRHALPPAESAVQPQAGDRAFAKSGEDPLAHRQSGSRTLHFSKLVAVLSSVEQAVTVTGPSIA